MNGYAAVVSGVLIGMVDAMEGPAEAAEAALAAARTRRTRRTA